MLILHVSFLRIWMLAEVMVRYGNQMHNSFLLRVPIKILEACKVAPHTYRIRIKFTTSRAYTLFEVGLPFEAVMALYPKAELPG